MRPDTIFSGFDPQNEEMTDSQVSEVEEFIYNMGRATAPEILEALAREFPEIEFSDLKETAYQVMVEQYEAEEITRECAAEARWSQIAL